MTPDLDKSAHSADGACDSERLETVADLIEIAGRLEPSTAIVPGGHRVEDLRLVESARDHGIVDRIILVGRKDHILSAVDEVGIEIPDDDIVDASDDNRMSEATVGRIREGGVDMVLKGGISTPIINRHMLPLAVRPTVSLATIFDAAPLAGGRPMLMTDSGVTTDGSLVRMADLVRNAVDVARAVMGIDRPRVAVLSANEKQIPSLPSTKIGLQLAQREWLDAVVCGPLSFDLATDPNSVSVKGMPDTPGAEEVAGRADILVCPGIDTANVMYKMIAAMNKYGDASLASITVGFPVPYIILSRSDTVETRLASIALSAVYARRRPPSAERPPGGAASPLDVLGLPPEAVRLVVAHYAELLNVLAVREGRIVDRSVSAPTNDAGDDMADHIAREIGRAVVAAGCDIEAIVLAGTLASDREIQKAVRRRVVRLAPVLSADHDLAIEKLAAGSLDELLADRRSME